MLLETICEGRLKPATKNRPASAALNGSANFIIKRIKAGLEKQGKPVTPELIIRGIGFLGSEEDGGWSDVVKNHAIQMVQDQG